MELSGLPTESSQTPSPPTYQAHYCPGCGRQYDSETNCTGSSELPHPAIQSVSTAELQDESSQHTPAPGTENLG